MSWHEPLAWAVALVICVPLAVLAVECVVAALSRRPADTPTAVRAAGRRCAVLIPAHDEQAGIRRTVAAVLPQLAAGDRVLVVADNCTDQTADAARSAGAEVVERFDPDRRGKGYALAFGVATLSADPPDVVVVLDADCVPEPGAMARLVDTCERTGRPVQAAYVMDPPPRPEPRHGVAAFAFVVKNVVRPTGLRRLGLPCLLTGTGMAFPWPAVRRADLGHGHIVEDMQLAVDLAAAGCPVRFEPAAVVRSEFPATAAATASQRRRWEHGHLSVLTSAVPSLLWGGVRRGRPGLVALALEVGVPPLSALVMGWAVGVGTLAIYGAATGFWPPAVVLLAAGGVSFLAVAAAWVRFGRGVLPAKSLASVPGYAVRKVPLYLGFLTGPQSTWVRTARTSSPT